jgi:hypothetical protein
MTDLLGCPFCGSAAQLDIHHENDDGTGIIECAVARCTNCRTSKERPSPSAAIAVWNTRSAPSDCGPDGVREAEFAAEDFNGLIAGYEALSRSTSMGEGMRHEYSIVAAALRIAALRSAQPPAVEGVSTVEGLTDFARRCQAYLDDHVGNGGHSDAAGSNAYELIEEAIEHIRPLTALPPVSGDSQPPARPPSLVGREAVAEMHYNRVRDRMTKLHGKPFMPEWREVSAEARQTQLEDADALLTLVNPKDEGVALADVRNAALEEAAQYHDKEAADCKAIAAVNQDNKLGADCETHAIDHEMAADDIRAMKSGSRP